MFLVAVQVADIVQLLEHKMGWVVEDMHAWMVACSFQEAFKGDAVVQVLARMKLVGEVYAVIVSNIQEELPAASQFLKAQLYQAMRTLRPGIDGGPEQRPRKDRYCAEPKITRCFDDFDDLP